MLDRESFENLIGVLFVSTDEIWGDFSIQRNLSCSFHVSQEELLSLKMGCIG